MLEHKHKSELILDYGGCFKTGGSQKKKPSWEFTYHKCDTEEFLDNFIGRCQPAALAWEASLLYTVPLLSLKNMFLVCTENMKWWINAIKKN